MIQTDGASAAQMSHDEGALIKRLLQYFFCTLDGHCTSVQCMSNGEPWDFRKSGNSCDWLHFIGSDGIVDACRNTEFLVQVKCNHASQQGCVLCGVFRSGQIIDHLLIDADGTVRACDDISASGAYCSQCVHADAVALQRISYLFVTEGELVQNIAELCHLFLCVTNGFLEYFFGIIIHSDFAGCGTEVQNKNTFFFCFVISFSLFPGISDITSARIL